MYKKNDYNTSIIHSSFCIMHYKKLTAVGRNIIAHKLTLLVLEIAANGHHRRIVGGEIQGREEDITMVTAGQISHGVTQTGVRRHAARQYQILAVALFERLLHLVCQ